MITFIFQAYTEYIHFINNLNEAAKDTNLIANVYISPVYIIKSFH
jgi:hypothetical protein